MLPQCYFLLLLLICSCKETSRKSFNPHVPEGYELIPMQGIDSYIGEIRSDSITFLFDYGFYSSSEPLSNHEIKERLSKSRRLEMNSNSCDFNFWEKLLSNEVKIDSIFYTNNQERGNKMSVRLIKNNDACLIESPVMQSDIVEQFSQFNFIESSKKGIYSKIYYPINPAFSNAGISIRESASHITLLYYTRNYNSERHEKILQILTSVRDYYE